MTNTKHYAPGTKHYSQMSQDLFVDHLLDSNSGYFIDVGCFEPMFINNTYMLEKKGFKGLLIDVNPYWVEMCEKYRSPESKYIEANLATENITDIMIKHESPKVIDYIDLDIDKGTLKVLKDIRFDLFSFKVITIEHDYYAHGDLYRTDARTLLASNGYQMVCADVCNNSGPQEDFYVNPKYVDESKWKPLVCSGIWHVELRKLMGIDDERLNWGKENYDAWHSMPTIGKSTRHKWPWVRLIFPT